MFVSKVSSHQADYNLYFKPGQSFSLQVRSSPTQSAPEGAGGSGKLGGVGKLGWAEEG